MTGSHIQYTVISHNERENDKECIDGQLNHFAVQ